MLLYLRNLKLRYGELPAVLLSDVASKNADMRVGPLSFFHNQLQQVLCFTCMIFLAVSSSVRLETEADDEISVIIIIFRSSAR